MARLFKPKQIYSLDLDIADDVSNQEDKITWNLNIPNPIVLSKNARIFLNEVKAKNTSTNYIKLYASSWLDDTDSFDSAYKSVYGALLYTIPFSTSASAYEFPNNDLIAYYTFNKNFNDSSGNGYNLDRTPYDNSHYTWSEEIIAATTTTFLRIGDELTFPSINQIPNIYNITSAGNHTIDFSTAGSIDVKLNGNSVLPSGFVKNGYPVLKQLLPATGTIQPIVWYKFDEEIGILKDSMGNYDLTAAGNPVLSTTRAKGTNSLYLGTRATDYLYTTNNFMDVDANTELSISVWVKKYETGVIDCVFSHGANSTNNQYGGVFLSNNKIRHYIWANDLDSTSTYGTDWYHFVFIWDPTGATKYFKTYVNGSLFQSRAYTSLSVTDQQFFIGKQANVASTGFKGNIDDFRVYDQVLTAEQVTELYTGSVIKYFQEFTTYTETFEYDDTRTDKGLYTWDVPSGVSEITAYVWGAGGGGCGGTANAIEIQYYGGSGAFVKANIDVSSSASLKIVVGQGGQGSDDGSIDTRYGGWGGGGNGIDSHPDWAVGSGGGLSGIFQSNNFGITSGVVNTSAIPFIISGAGGGGGGGTVVMGGGGGGGGSGFVGGKDGGNNSDVHNGRGGTGSAGGIAGDGSIADGTAGSKYLGGDGPSTGITFGAGGGAGLYGGGGGGISSNKVGGGGGGSSYWGHSSVTYIADVGGGNGISSASAAPNISSYVSGITLPARTAQGGATSSTFNGGNGFIAIQYTRQVNYNDFTFAEISPYNYVLVSQDDTPDRQRSTSQEVPLFTYMTSQTALTISFDLKVTGYNSSGIDLILKSENENLLIRGRDNGNLEFRFSPATSTVRTIANAYQISDNFKNYTMIFDIDSSLKFYIDGVIIYETDLSFYVPEFVDWNLVDGLIIGEFVGELKGLRLYNVALDITPTITGGNEIIDYQNSSYKYQKNFKVNERLLAGGQKIDLKLIDGTKSDLSELKINFIIYDEELGLQNDTNQWNPNQITDNKKTSNFYK